MIGRAEIDKLTRLQAAEPVVLSLYLSVALDPAELRELPARAGDLIAAAEGGPGHGGRKRVKDADRAAMRSTVAAHGRDSAPSGDEPAPGPWPATGR